MNMKMIDDELQDFYETPSTTPDFKTELAAQLSELIPEAIADGKVDVEKLKELLSRGSASPLRRQSSGSHRRHESRSCPREKYRIRSRP